MSRNLGHSLLSAAAILLGFGAVFFLSSFLEKNRVSLPADYEDSDLDLQGKHLAGYALGAEGLLSDWYWMRSLQYIGKKIVSSKNDNLNIENLQPLNPRLLFPMLDNSTTLDPKFMAPYSYGATVLPAIDTSKAIELTEKGIANNPDQWRLYQYLGYIYWRDKNYAKAAEVYQKGSEIPGAPGFMVIMAARMTTEGGSRETARAMYMQSLEGAQDQETKITAERRLTQLDAFDEMDAVNPILANFAERQGRCVNGWGEVIPLLKNVKLPHDRDFKVDRSNNLIDPAGVPYILDTIKCSINLSLESVIPRF